jgi:hypothetical protein
MVQMWSTRVAILLVGALADVAPPALKPGLRGAHKNASNLGSILKTKVQDDFVQCDPQATNPFCGGTKDPSKEMGCSPVYYRPLTFNMNNPDIGPDATDCGNDGPYLGTMANGQDFNGGLDPYWTNVRAWAGDFTGQGNPDYFVFHGCDGAGIQPDCLGDIKYIERIEYHYTSDSDWQHEDGNPDVSDGQAVLDGNVKDFKDAFPDGICDQRFFNFDQDVRTYCKFVHPGTELVHNGYTGGWWGSEKEGDDSAFGSVDMGFTNTEGTWDPNGDGGWDKPDDFGSAATGPWTGPLKQNVQNIPNSFDGWHPFTEGKTFSFMLFDWRCEASDADTNSFSYPSINSKNRKCFVDNEPGTLGYPPHVEIYFGTLTTDADGKDCIKLLRWDSQADGSLVAVNDNPAEPYVLYPVRANDGSNVPY